MDASEFTSQRRFAETASERIAYVETSTGPAALFVPGARLFFPEDMPAALVGPLQKMLEATT